MGAYLSILALIFVIPSAIPIGMVLSRFNIPRKKILQLLLALIAVYVLVLIYNLNFLKCKGGDAEDSRNICTTTTNILLLLALITPVVLFTASFANVKL